jgi:hypothetical protein
MGQLFLRTIRERRLASSTVRRTYVDDAKRPVTGFPESGITHSSGAHDSTCCRGPLAANRRTSNEVARRQWVPVNACGILEADFANLWNRKAV